MSGEALALLLTFLVHAVGLIGLFVALALNDGGSWRDWWPDDDGPDDGPQPDPPGPLPLADAEQSRHRLREPGRLADSQRRPTRRPEHAPQRTPQRTPTRR